MKRDEGVRVCPRMVAHPGLREDAHCGRASACLGDAFNVNDEMLVFPLPCKYLVGSVVRPLQWFSYPYEYVRAC